MSLSGTSRCNRGPTDSTLGSQDSNTCPSHIQPRATIPPEQRAPCLCLAACWRKAHLGPLPKGRALRPSPPPQLELPQALYKARLAHTVTPRSLSPFITPLGKTATWSNPVLPAFTWAWPENSTQSRQSSSGILTPSLIP